MTNNLARLALLSALLVLAARPALSHDTADRPRTMALTATGEVRAIPDMAVISTGVVTEGKTAREALSDNNALMEMVIGTIRDAGVEKKDVQTSNFSVQPKYVYPKRKSTGEQDPPRIVGYTVSNTVTVIVRDLKGLGAALDAVVTSGANQASGLSFTVAEPEPLRNDARRKAVADAIARAELYAEAAGVTLGPIRSITEAGGIRPPRSVARRMALEAAADAVPVEQGQQSVSVTVNIEWEIE